MGVNGRGDGGGSGGKSVHGVSTGAVGVEGDNYAETAEGCGAVDGVRTGVLHCAAGREVCGPVDGLCEAGGAGVEESEEVERGW